MPEIINSTQTTDPKTTQPTDVDTQPADVNTKPADVDTQPKGDDPQGQDEPKADDKEAKSVKYFKDKWKAEQQAKAELEARIAELEKGDKKDPTLEERLAELEKANQELTQREQQAKKQNYLNSQLTKAGVDQDFIDDGVVETVLKKLGYEYDPATGEIEDFEEAIEALKTTRPKLFGEPKKTTKVGTGQTTSPVASKVNLENLRNGKSVSDVVANYDDYLAEARKQSRI